MIILFLAVVEAAVLVRGLEGALLGLYLPRFRPLGDELEHVAVREER